MILKFKGPDKSIIVSDLTVDQIYQPNVNEMVAITWVDGDKSEDFMIALGELLNLDCVDAELNALTKPDDEIFEEYLLADVIYNYEPPVKELANEIIPNEQVANELIAAIENDGPKILG